MEASADLCLFFVSSSPRLMCCDLRLTLYSRRFRVYWSHIAQTNSPGFG